MVGLSNALSIATSGMNLSQTGLATVSHNIVNTNSDGYTRQLVQSQSVSVNGFGNGVQLEQVQRVVDQFLVTKSLIQQADVSYANTNSTYLTSIEGTVSNASGEGSLETLAGNFYSSLNSLSNDVGNSALKLNAVQSATLLTDTVRGVRSNLNDIQQRVDSAITDEVSSVNNLLKRVYDLNQQISSATVGTANGANVNDLRDERDRDLQTLAETFKLQVTTNTSNGGYRVTTETGRRLVDESGYVQFERTTGSPFGGIAYRNVNADGSLAANTIDPVVDNMTSGRMKALFDLRDTTIPKMTDELDEFSSTLITQVNNVASQGSSFPPQRTLTSQALSGVTSTSSDLYTELSSSLPGSTFNISVVDTQGNVQLTTAGGTPITLPSLPGTFSLDDLATLINNNATVGNTSLGGTLGVTATAATDASGKPYIQIQTANSNLRVVLSNASGNVLGTLGMNTILSGSSSSDIAVKSALVSDPSLFPTARMNTDGSLSSLNNQNAIALAQLGDTNFSFSAAGDIPALTTTSVKYLNSLVSSLATKLNDAKSRETYATTLQTQLNQQKASTSGVNMNEELGLMLVYQQSFQASARIVSVVDGLMQELTNMVSGR